MEIIRNYLESMFAGLPNTAEVLKAKDELYSMMEDKYNELIAEGRPENEAVSTVISEFGNLEEISESLGIHSVVQDTEPIESTLITYDQADAYIRQKMKYRLITGLGVMLCIFSPVGLLMFENNGQISALNGLIALFLMVAAGVGLIIYSAAMMHRWSFLDEYPCYIDYATYDHLILERETNRSSRALCLILGIVLCILSVVPIIVFETVKASYLLTDGLGPAIMLIMVGIGVMLIIYSGGRNAGVSKMIHLNDTDTVSGNYRSKHDETEHYTNRTVGGVMESYWSIVTCIYLIWSFLTFHWYITWIIWPVAGIAKGILDSIFGTKEAENE